MTEFASVGAGYSEQLQRGLSLTGEDAQYFAERRVGRVQAIATRAAIKAKVVVDFGCGSGVAFSALRAHFPHARIIGFEPERNLRSVARLAAEAAAVELIDSDTLSLQREADVVYCNGVFHHIPISERASAMGSIRESLRARGLACVWENSPFNPGTRWVMSRIPFDRDAQLLTPGALQALQRDVGLEHHLTEFHFVFPRPLAVLRPLENVLRGLPFGGQYLVAGFTAA